MPGQYPPVLVRTYVGPFAQTVPAFQTDATFMAQGGYVPVTQSYEPGNWSGVTVLIGLLLSQRPRPTAAAPPRPGPGRWC